jgi:lipid-A-disaccharide synthase
MSLNAGDWIFISAGEFSGDLLGAELVESLRAVYPSANFFGITGPSMKSAGVLSVATTDELSVMGIIEVAKKVCDIRQIEQRIFTWTTRLNPKIAILIDFPGFHFHLAEQLRLRSIPVFQYVAPKVWAWGKKRIPALKRDFTQVLGILPFEEDFFKSHGINYTYVGSPYLERSSHCKNDLIGTILPNNKRIVSFLPGSRLSEIKRILPEIMNIRASLETKSSDLFYVIPLAPSLEWSDVSEVLGHPQVAPHPSGLGFSSAGITWIYGRSMDVMKSSKVAVVASGTATLECALANTPMVVLYIMNDLSYWIARKAVSIKWASLVNLLMNEEIVKEHLQTIDAETVAKEVLELLRDSDARKKMLGKFSEIGARLKPNAANNAAAILKTYMDSI